METAVAHSAVQDFDLNKPFHVVEFHADGGQACIDGKRTFDDPFKAFSFAQTMRAEPGHACGPESVHTYSTTERDPDDGVLYHPKQFGARSEPTGLANPPEFRVPSYAEERMREGVHTETPARRSMSQVFADALKTLGAWWNK